MSPSGKKAKAVKKRAARKATSDLKMRAQRDAGILPDLEKRASFDAGAGAGATLDIKKRASRDAGVSPDLRLIHGVSLGDDLILEDWNAWMAGAPDMLRVTLAEGERDPEVTVANLFRRLFPDQPWPPATDSPLMPTYHRIVAIVGRTLERPFKPHVEIVS